MLYLRSTAAATVLFIGLVPAGCGPSEAELQAVADRAAALDAQAERELQETLAVLAEAEEAMRPRAAAPALTYDAFRGQAIEPTDEATADSARPASATAEAQ